MTNQEQMSEQEQQEWIRNQYQVATKYLADKGLVTESVVDTESRYLVPLFSVWKLKLMDKSYVWVVCGDLPTDHITAGAAPNAREAVHNFSLKWQLQAENLLRTGVKEQEEFAKILIGRADGLYDLYNNEQLWHPA